MENGLEEPLDSKDAKRLIREITREGEYALTRHAEQELAKDNLTSVDCVNVLRAGIVDAPEWENGQWRYHVRTGRIEVVVSFRSPTKLVVITAWRITK